MEILPFAWHLNCNDSIDLTDYTCEDGSTAFYSEYFTQTENLKIIPHPSLSKFKCVEDKESLHELVFKNWKIDSVNLLLCKKLLTKTISDSIHSIKFYNASLSENQIQLVAEILSGSDCVKSLAIDFNDTVLEDSTVYAELLHHENQLESLSLRSNGIDAKGGVAIAKRLTRHKSITSINLFGNVELGDDTALAFKRYLPFSESVKELSLSKTGVSDDGMTQVVASLVEYKITPALETEIQNAEEEIVQMMGKKQKVKKDRATCMQELGIPQVRTSGAEQIADGNHSLACLNLSFNGITTTGLISINTILIKYDKKLKMHLSTIHLQDYNPNLSIPDLSNFIHL